MTNKLNEWRAKVYKKWNNQCQGCWTKKNKTAHHIHDVQLYPEKRFDEDNGIVLCKNCHQQFHEAYGKVGAGPTHLEQFLYRKRRSQ